MFCRERKRKFVFILLGKYILVILFDKARWMDGWMDVFFELGEGRIFSERGFWVGGKLGGREYSILCSVN